MRSLRVSRLLSLVFLAAVTACSLSTAPTPIPPTAAPPTQSAPTATPTPLIAATIEVTADATTDATAALLSTPAATADAESTASAQLYLIRQPLPGPACSISPTGGQGVNIRRDPTKQSAAIGGLLRGAWVLAKGLDASGKWFQISAPNTPVDGGWITGQNVAIRGVCNCVPDGSCERGAPIPTARPAATAESTP